MKKQILILAIVLVVVLANVAYWILNKKFLHDALITAIAGGSSTPELSLETPSQSTAASTAQALVETTKQGSAINEKLLVDETATESTQVTNQVTKLTENQADNERAQISAMIAVLKSEIDLLESQTAEISGSINGLVSDTQAADQRIQDVSNTYNLSVEQLDQILIENSTNQATESEFATQ